MNEINTIPTEQTHPDIRAGGCPTTVQPLNNIRPKSGHTPIGTRRPQLGRPAIPSGGNDRIYTPDELAEAIVQHFRPSGEIVEPAAGGGAFLRALGPDCDWYEIDKNKDFLTAQGHWDWAITNPPYSKFRQFLVKAMEVSDNVVFLCLDNAWHMRARRRDMQNAGFGIVETCECPVPPPPFPQFGMCLGATWIRRGWHGSTHFSELQTNLWQIWNRRPGQQNSVQDLLWV